MTIVVDASMAAAWLLPDERDAATDDVLAMLTTSYGLAPSLFRHEVRNILLVSERRKRITAAIGDALSWSWRSYRFATVVPATTRR